MVRDHVDTSERERMVQRGSARVGAEPGHRARLRRKAPDVEGAFEHQWRSGAPVDVDVVDDAAAQPPLESELAEDQRSSRGIARHVTGRRERLRHAATVRRGNEQVGVGARPQVRMGWPMGLPTAEAAAPGKSA